MRRQGPKNGKNDKFRRLIRNRATKTGVPLLIALIVNRSSRRAGLAADITGAFTMAWNR